jgi:hypothetical protein
MRLLVQSISTGRFLVPGEFGSPVWERDLSQCGGGIVDDTEHASKLIVDHCDCDDLAVVVDLDQVLQGT